MAAPSLLCRVGGVGAAITVAVLFGSGIPMLYAVAAIGLILRHLTERHCLLQLSRAPARYHCSLPYLTAGMLHRCSASNSASVLHLECYSASAWHFCIRLPCIQYHQSLPEFQNG
jgi:hypothetical protein